MSMIVDGNMGRYSAYLCEKYSMTPQSVVSAQVMVSLSWEECGNPTISNFTPLIEALVLVAQQQNSLSLNALGLSMDLPTILGINGRITIYPRNKVFNFSTPGSLRKSSSL